MDSTESAFKIGKRNTEVVGILRTMNDIRRIDSKAFNEIIAEDFPELVFETPIKQDIPFSGFIRRSERRNVER